MAWSRKAAAGRRKAARCRLCYESVQLRHLHASARALCEMPCPEPWVCWCTVFGQVQAGLHKSLPRLGRAAAFLELAICHTDSVVTCLAVTWIVVTSLRKGRERDEFVSMERRQIQ